MASSSRSRSRRRDDESSSRRRRRRRTPSSGESSSDGETTSSSDEESRSRSGSRRERRRSHRRSRSPESRKKKRSITEEEITDYAMKKMAKRSADGMKKLKGKDSGYSNDANPFGDASLNDKFIWRKKIERDISQGTLTPDMLSAKAERKRQKERTAELEKVKKRREERAIEKARHEEEMEMLARERARAEFQDWEKKEEEFHFDQSKVRSHIRLREGRMKPIDILSKNLSGSEEFDIDVDEPYMVFKGLSVKEMEELRDDIKMHLDLDRATQIHVKYWEALLVVCDWEILESRKRDVLDRARVRGEEPPPELVAEERDFHSTIEEDVKTMLHGKPQSELETMQEKIESELRLGTAKVVEYWEAVLKRLQIYKAKACLKEIHGSLLRKHLERLEPIQYEREDELEDEPTSEIFEEKVPPEEDFGPEFLRESDLIRHDPEEQLGSFSPEPQAVEDDDEALDPEIDRIMMERKRAAMLEKQHRQAREALAAKPVDTEDSMEMKAIKSMGAVEEGDAVFGSGAEVNLDSQVYWWHDKYRPRKPKYFNRVHTGYEWNKYNQTHYDHDNPPPKIVQGYKFNIFYPDLVDKTKAPVYTIEKDENNSETCLIRFHAGPPYEDIAFRIVNKEWEYSHKKGFKCTFERGILHVYFNFKRYRYRR